MLHVLHKSISLAHLPEKEVFELLRKRPVFSPLEGDISDSSREVREEKLDETQKAGGSEDATEDDPEKEQDAEIHPEVQRDIFLYHSYCALRNFMGAVTCSVENSARDSLEKGQVSGEGQSAESLSSGTSEHFDANSEDSCQEQAYCGQVTSKLDAGKYHLAHVYPLTYRVEILENIFSLLFGTYEDLYEGRTQCNESDDLETMDEETRSLSKSSRTGSLESLVSSVDLSFDGHGTYSPLKDQEKMYSQAVSLLPTPNTPQRQKEPSAPTTFDSPSRRQLFKNSRSESDSALLKKGLDGDETMVPLASQAASDRVKGRLSEDESLSGNLHSSKGPSRAAPAPDENDLKCEFVIDDAVVPDMLKTLKECLMELNTAKFSELKKGMSLLLPR